MPPQRLARADFQAERKPPAARSQRGPSSQGKRLWRFGQRLPGAQRAAAPRSVAKPTATAPRRSPAGRGAGRRAHTALHATTLQQRTSSVPLLRRAATSGPCCVSLADGFAVVPRQ